MNQEDKTAAIQNLHAAFHMLDVLKQAFPAEQIAFKTQVELVLQVINNALTPLIRTVEEQPKEVQSIATEDTKMKIKYVNY